MYFIKTFSLQMCKYIFKYITCKFQYKFHKEHVINVVLLLSQKILTFAHI